ncbi:MAG: hypothetical protein WCO56_11915 [Verrucomicrobiota bacterium]
MNDADMNQLLEAAWRRELTTPECAELQTWLANHPEARAKWAAELALTSALRGLPDVPVSSNFTHRVLQAIDQETVVATTQTSWLDRVFGPGRLWLPRFAMGLFVVGIGVMGYLQHQHSVRSELVVSVKEVSLLANVSTSSQMKTVEVWQDFDAIRRLGTTGPDMELLSLLK